MQKEPIPCQRASVLEGAASKSQAVGVVCPAPPAMSMAGVSCPAALSWLVTNTSFLVGTGKGPSVWEVAGWVDVCW